ncbi:MAG: holo-ACP synthase [Negativicutes bacterium]|nr:holo-ACP synthase [Negativicutes bacterium]
MNDNEKPMQSLAVSQNLVYRGSPGRCVAAVGVDYVSVARVAAALAKLQEKFVRQVLSEAEWETWQDNGLLLSAEHLAGRWAAKEAVAKALGSGFIQGITWKNIEIRHNTAGAPQVVLNGAAAQLAEEKGITQWLISISHDKEMAVAFVEALAEAQDSGRLS